TENHVAEINSCNMLDTRLLKHK